MESYAKKAEDTEAAVEIAIRLARSGEVQEYLASGNAMQTVIRGLIGLATKGAQYDDIPF